jgi:arginine/lysine/ornithine decarboxylase
MSVGADLTVQSTHKTLSAMTQSSMLHIQGNRVCSQRISQALQLVQSTSPSYLLLASLDAARQQMATAGQELMSQAIALATNARNEIAEIPHLSILSSKVHPGFKYLDPTRLTINVSQLGITGFAADEILHQQLGVTCELPLLEHLTFIISLGNTEEDIHRLIGACSVLSSKLQALSSKLSVVSSQLSAFGSHSAKVSPREAYFRATETVPIEQAGDRLCGELICPYPPGIPLLMPGEMITGNVIEYLKQVVAAGATITGCKDPHLQTIETLK